MYIYNVTVNIDSSIEQQWLHWMKTKHIAEILKTGKFFKAVLIQVLIEEELGGTTYSVQYYAHTKQAIQQYYIEDAPQLRAEGQQLFGEKMLAFRTELQVLSEFTTDNI